MFLVEFFEVVLIYFFVETALKGTDVIGVSAGSATVAEAMDMGKTFTVQAL